MDPSARAHPLLEDLRGGVTIRVRGADRDDGHFGPGRRYQLRSGPVPASVMSDLHHLHSRQRLPGKPVPDLADLRVAHQESAKLAVLDDEAERGIVLVAA